MRILEQLAPDMGIVDITRLLMQAHNRQPEYIIHDEDNPVKMVCPTPITRPMPPSRWIW
jgi:hypothetical protein